MDNTDKIAEKAKRILERKSGIGADGLVKIEKCEGSDGRVRLFHGDGREGGFCATALISAAKFLHDNGECKNVYTLSFLDKSYTVRLSTMGKRVLCAWIEMPKINPRPMEQLKYYHGIRGEVLRACIAHPRVSVYELCGAHAVFMLESCAALRKFNMRSCCKRLEEVLFFGESIDLHFAAIAGDNTLSMRTWRCRTGEISALAEGAVLCAYAATEYETVDSSRIIVKATGGNFCVELCGNKSSLCAKCETVFSCDAT
jgi:diaminopimelate epimerase